MANFRLIYLPGGLLQSFSEEEVMRTRLKFAGGGGGGYNVGSGKQLLAIKASFRVNKPDFRGLMSK